MLKPLKFQDPADPPKNTCWASVSCMSLIPYSWATVCPAFSLIVILSASVAIKLDTSLTASIEPVV